MIAVPPHEVVDMNWKYSFLFHLFQQTTFFGLFTRSIIRAGTGFESVRVSTYWPLYAPYQSLISNLISFFLGTPCDLISVTIWALHRVAELLGHRDSSGCERASSAETSFQKNLRHAGIHEDKCGSVCVNMGEALRHFGLCELYEQGLKNVRMTFYIPEYVSIRFSMKDIDIHFKNGAEIKYLYDLR